MTYNKFKKQAGFGTNIAIGAGIGAVGGGLASLLPTSADKKKRLRRAIMLIGSGAIIGGSTGAAISKLMPINNNAEYTSKQKRRAGYDFAYNSESLNKVLDSRPSVYNISLAEALYKGRLADTSPFDQGVASATLDLARKKGIDLYKQRDNGFPVDYRLNTANQLTNSMPRDFYLDR